MATIRTTCVSLPSCTGALRPSTASSLPNLAYTQTRNATFIPRPRRPYTFTQLVVLSDGSAYQHRTTSPLPVYKSIKDTRNSPLWNPTSEKLSNMEVDEAGRLAAFRERFGRGWDAKSGNSEEVAREEGDELSEELGEEQHGDLMDLLSGYASSTEQGGSKEEPGQAKGAVKGSAKGAKKPVKAHGAIKEKSKW